MPGMSVDAVRGFRDKELMKVRMRAAGLRVPRSARVRSAADVREVSEQLGYPLACAAAQAVLDTLVADELCANAVRMGERLVQGLRARLAGIPGVVEVRGRGLMVGIELREPCAHLVQAALEQGLLINVTSDNVIRLLPPLVIRAAEVDQIIDTLAALIAAQAGGAQSAA